MLFLKTNPAGIDIRIQRLQTKLHDSLLAVWGIPALSFECYGRCYKNQSENGYIAEVLTGGNEYKEVYWDDRLTAISFFGIDSEIKSFVLNRASVHLIFFLNLVKIKPLILHRADEEVRQDVIKIIGNSMYGFLFDGVELTLENVLREYKGSGLKTVDMHPVHCFRINLVLNYK